MKELREVIRDLRDDHDMTQKQVAAYLNVSQQCYQSYESGRCAIPTTVLSALARLYRVSADYLLGMETSYFGNTNLMSIYYENVTVYKVLYDMQKVKKNKRKELLSFINFLNSEDA
ncbi:MAG: helix-turn-helix domain-containing protein [Lachnospiraceae bacterium]|nr:helix-turn-helix domain-containing protein [Lachnospiraceae bacterium]